MSKNSLYVPKNTALSTIDNLVIKVIEKYGGVLSTANPHTWTGIQTFSTSPVISSITNTGTITLPTTTGTLALLNQIPTNADYVDLVSPQSIFGAKIFNNIFASNLIGCLFYSNPIGGGGHCSFDTTSASSFNGVIKLPSLASSCTYTLPTNSGYLLNSKGNYSTVSSQGITLSDNQTISTAAYLLGTTINCDSSIYTDSATAASGTVASVADVLIGQRTYTATNTSVTYTACSSLRIKGPPIASTNITIAAANAILIDSGNIRLTNGRYFSSALGSATAPAYCVGTSLNDGIYSSAAGNINIATAGTLRATFSSAGLTLASAMNIIMSGGGSVTSGTGGFTSAGPVSSSLTSSAAACSVRPTNNANTGIFGTAATALNFAVGGTQILGLTTTGASITGTLSLSGALTLAQGATGLSFYGVSNVSSTVTFGTYTSSNFTFNYVRIGNKVTLSCGGINLGSSPGAQNATITVNTTGGVNYMPATATYITPIAVYNNTGSSTYLIQITPTTITIGTFGNALNNISLGAGQSLNIYGFSVTYVI